MIVLIPRINTSYMKQKDESIYLKNKKKFIEIESITNKNIII